MKVEKNSVVTLEFTVFDMETDEVLEETSDMGPFFYIHGTESFIDKIEEALDGEEIGYECAVELTPEDAYGEIDPELIEEISKTEFEAEFDDIYEGMEFEADMDDGSVANYVIKFIEDDVVTIDGNHPFAGKSLRFEIKIAGIRPATDEELKQGHPVFKGFDN